MEYVRIFDSGHLVKKENIQKRDKVLIIGSNGSVGAFAVQLVKNFGTIKKKQYPCRAKHKSK